MQITSTNNLSNNQIKSIEKLLKKVHTFDHTYRDPYLASDYNFDKDMPAFFLAYNESDDLIGLLATYADSKDVEIQLKIDPSYRRQGLANRLYQTFLQETKEYKLNTVSFVTEEVFLDKNPDLLENLNLTRYESEEYQLSRKYKQEDLDDSWDYSDLIFEKASLKDVDELTQLTHEAFDSDIEVAERYNIASIESDTVDIYVLRNDKDIISRVSVDFASDVNYMYSVATKKEYLRQGYAYKLLAKTIKTFEDINTKDFQIAVDAENTKAKNLYEKLGFKVDTKILYLDARDMNEVF
ncbi:GNAT family N-acetyltransferase [uncultured Helcococcus sp.]|uniref:GNAT family N-acetyltransferase n=1 Tax=uncultured Helcococcus sp. TaxID=1072508 RepID=UPI0026080A54|nr:GNAT family N-acetyltransferase [uncultured Helcococcus sp.]